MRDKLRLQACCGPVVLLLVASLLVLSAGVAEAQSDNQPFGLTATVVGRNVTLEWRPPVHVTQPLTGYLLEAGPSPGATAIALPLGNVLGYSVSAPDGRYFVRVRGLFGATPGPASNEVAVAVPELPTPPTNVTGTVARFTVTVTWSRGVGSAPVTAWQLQAGSAPGLSDFASVQLPVSTRSVTATVAAGTYYVRVLALNPSGASPPSAEVVLTTGPGICDIPTVPTGLSAIAGEGGVLLRWDPWTGGVPDGYLLAAGYAPGASDIGTFTLPRTTSFGSFAPAATYYVKLTAFNACGISPTSPEIAFSVTPPNDASLVGTWNGTVSNYALPYPWTPITSFQLTLGASPSGFGSQLPGLWVDNKGCRSTRTFGGIDVLPFVSIEELPCNDGDFTMRITSRTATVVEGRCNSGPNCSFRMTRQ